MLIKSFGVEFRVAIAHFRQWQHRLRRLFAFNKAHAACFAVVSYASAWLRTYFPAEFAAAILNNEPMGFYSSRLVLDDARRHGIEVLPADVNRSLGDHSVEKDGHAIRVGLKDVLHMNERLLRTLEQERSVRPFDDLADFLRRTRAEIDAAESLVRVGALDGLGTTDAGRPPTRDEQLALLAEPLAHVAALQPRLDVARCLVGAPLVGAAMRARRIPLLELLRRGRALGRRLAQLRPRPWCASACG